MVTHLREVYGKPVPQSEPIMGREDEMVKNSAGGYVFPVDDFVRLRRFLVLGSEGGSYYAEERQLTVENAKCVRRCIDTDGERTVDVIVDVSFNGRAPRNSTAIFALAMAAAFGNEATRKKAYGELPNVARTASMLFEFVSYRDDMGGWGRGFKNAIANWYENQFSGENPDRNLAYQLLKYRQRNGWTHRDLLRKAHVVPAFGDGSLLKYVVKNEVPEIPLVQAFVKAQTAEPKDLVDLIQNEGLTREMIPSEHLNKPDVMRALFKTMPMTALIRNLGNLTKAGILQPMGGEENAEVIRRLGNRDILKRARIHPLTLLNALQTYRSGRGLRGSNSWTVVPQIVDALDNAVALSFDLVEPTGKRFYLGVDISGSMGSRIANMSLSCRDAAAVMALVIAKTEPNYFIGGFGSGGSLFFLRRRNPDEGLDGFVDLGITAGDSIKSAVDKTSRLPFGGTDCAIPMLHALKHKIPVDCFVVLTDSETWAGQIHPRVALQKYRNEMGIASKLIVVSMVPNEFSIADPADAGMLDVVGFDTSVPQVMSDFVTN